MSDSLDLLKPEAVARLRHHLRTPLNHTIGYAEMIYRQAKDQGASAEMEAMEGIIEAARRIGDMVSEALPASSHIGEGSIPRLQTAMRGYLDRIADAADRFQQLAPGACKTEIGKIRHATRQLIEFASGSNPRPAGSAAAPRRAPVEHTYAMPAAAAPQVAQARPTQAPSAEERILVVDDDATNREILEHGLHYEGYIAVSEPNGLAAMERLRREPFNLVLLDIFMPLMDGFQVLAAMKASPELRDIPVIVLSAAEQQEYVVRSIEMGAEDFLPKPFDPVFLRARIGAIIRRRKAELERAEIARRMESLLESSGEGIFGVDATGACTFVNRAAAELLGHSRQSLLGRGLHEVIHHTHPDGAPYPHEECPIAAVRLTGQPRRSSDERFFRADGSSFPVEFSAQPIRRGETWDGMVVTFTDISERKRTEEHLLQTAKLESLGLLAGGIAHDFNNILTGIIGNTALVMGALPTGDRSHARLAEVVRSSERAADLTRQMLAYAGKGQFVLEAVDISESIHSIAELLRTSLPKCGRLEFCLAPDLPKLTADPRQIHQVVFNLVINAGEATEDRDGVIRVETGVREFLEPLAGQAPFDVIPPGRYIYLAVADNGTGIDPAFRARIFDPFFSTRFAGRGLGLAAAMGIVRAHHGAIRVESQPGRGSRFEVLFPV